MTTYAVVSRSTGEEVYRYSNDAPVEWSGMEFDVCEHLALPDPVVTAPVLVPEEWRIDVGSFYDRFGAMRFPILSSTDPEVGAFIRDTQVRKFIDLLGRRAELSMAIQLLQSKGYGINEVAVLDVKPTEAEVYRG